MYWDTRLNYPFVCLVPPIVDVGSRVCSSSLSSSPSSSSSPSPTVVSSSPVSPPLPSIHVRLLHWGLGSGSGLPSPVLVRADEIEGYSPQNEEESEYVRRRVRVTMTNVKSESNKKIECNDLSPHQVWAWIYVHRESKPVEGHWTHLTAGDWMKRDRSIKRMK